MAAPTQVRRADAGVAPAPVLSRRRRLWAKGLVYFAVVITVLSALLVGAAVKNDLAINARTGKAEAEVLITELRRTLIAFTTPDGTTHTPSNGVQYPGGLKTGDIVRVEYDRRDPEHVRVAGRSAVLLALPVLSTLVVVWLLCLGLSWWLRRPRAAFSA